MTSPDTTISTRRFCCLPVAVLLSAIGEVLPNPGGHAGLRQSLPDEVPAHSVRTLLRELLVRFIASDAIRMTLNGER